ncbi:MAG: ATP-binding protein [Coriobacteriia bacterium]|nr:ATP-binding protein [Coriobacteriia bacterium]
MTLTDEHFARLASLRMRAAAEQLRQIIDSGRYREMTIDECVIEMIEAEEEARSDRKVAKLHSKARFANPGACMEDIIYLPGRSVDRGYIERLASGGYIDGHDHVVIISETGCGKGYLAQALGNAACRQKRSVRYIRHPDLCKELGIARKTGEYYDLMQSLIDVDLLLLDDFSLTSIPEANVIDTFEIIEARVDRGSMVVASQFEPNQWHLMIKAETLADSIIDRIVHRAHYIDITGPNMRELASKQSLA